MRLMRRPQAPRRACSCCLLLAGVYVHLRRSSPRSSPTTTRSRCRPPTSACSCPSRADVKIRGVIVGEVLDFDADRRGRRADPGHLPRRGRHDPGQRHRLDRAQDAVRREVRRRSRSPRTRPPTTIEAGDIIERTEVSIEVEKVLSDLYPLLRTVQPAEINKTLNALATALEGRGEQLGENLETVDSYLKRINPQIPDIVEDLRLTAQVSDIYADVMPEIADDPAQHRSRPPARSRTARTS